MNIAITAPKPRKMIPIRKAAAEPVIIMPKPLYVAVATAWGRPHYGPCRIA